MEWKRPREGKGVRVGEKGGGKGDDRRKNVKGRRGRVMIGRRVCQGEEGENMEKSSVRRKV